eukprot:7802115-Alexandrium_andersonii.AAC.1
MVSVPRALSSPRSGQLALLAQEAEDDGLRHGRPALALQWVLRMEDEGAQPVSGEVERALVEVAALLDDAHLEVVLNGPDV